MGVILDMVGVLTLQCRVAAVPIGAYTDQAQTAPERSETHGFVHSPKRYQKPLRAARPMALSHA